jgi:sRNA-binding carbon storage regulator CsrA
MLAISRKPREIILIQLPDGRRITLGVSHATRIYIDAPRDIGIVRAEVVKSIEETVK